MPPAEESPQLGGAGILVTRAADQAGALASAIEGAGGTPVCFPALEIRCEPVGAIGSRIADLGEPDIVVFVSPNAARCGARALAAWPQARVAAVGPATAASLETAGGDTAILPPGEFDSEGLLATPALADVAGRRVIIVRGSGGRERLAAGLRERGAEVAYLDVYRRERPRPAESAVAALEARWSAGGIAAVTCLSAATYENLRALLGATGRRLLAATPLVTPSRRVLQIAVENGHRGRSAIAADASAPALIEAVAGLLAGASAGASAKTRAGVPAAERDGPSRPAKGRRSGR